MTSVNPRRAARGAFALGFACSGFLDGILLHQILQWHHLLSGLTSSAFNDLRYHVLADGLFHALMYIIGAVGVYWLYRSHRAGPIALPPKGVLRAWLLGFGTWHVADGVLSHWLLGLHRIKMDADVPLAWDLAWFIGLGLVPIWIGWRMGKPSPPPSGGTCGPIRTWVVWLLAGPALLAGALNAFPLRPPSGDAMTVVLRPGAQPGALFAALGADDRVVWQDIKGGVWVIKPGPTFTASRYYAQGALWVSNTSIGGGCMQWVTWPA